jgi:hypothetical protein
MLPFHLCPQPILTLSCPGNDGTFCSLLYGHAYYRKEGRMELWSDYLNSGRLSYDTGEGLKCSTVMGRNSAFRDKLTTFR